MTIGLVVACVPVATVASSMPFAPLHVDVLDDLSTRIINYTNATNLTYAYAHDTYCAQRQTELQRHCDECV